jgi:hypothetical protein
MASNTQPDKAGARRSKLPERHFLDQVVGALAQDEIGARPRRQDVLAQVLQVDVRPKAFGDGARRISESWNNGGRRTPDCGRRSPAAA